MHTTFKIDAALFLIFVPLCAGCAMSQPESNSAEADAQFRIEPMRPIEELRIDALAARPPLEEDTFRTPDLVDLAELDQRLLLDIRYASAQNFMSTPFYREARAYLQRPAAAALLRALDDLWGEGYGIIVFDAYRPWFVTKMFWDATPDSLKHFVAPPENGSRHNRGAAVDVALYDADTGEPVEMPSGYDEFTERAYVDYDGASRSARRHRELLRAAMERHGFAVYPYEWWHFDHEDWQDYAILNVPFEDIGN